MRKLFWAVLLALVAPLCHATTCDQWLVGSDASSGLTQLVALQQGKAVYVCSFAVTTASTSLVTTQLQYGTGSACATGTGSLGLLVPLLATATNPLATFVLPLPPNANWQTPLSNALCLNLGAAQTVYYQINYTVL